MSVEFEKVVLEKLDNLSKTMSETKEKVSNLEEKVENNSTLINNLSEKVENNSTLINNLSEKVEQQGLNFAKFENELTIKVQALFDSFSANSESHTTFHKAIATLNAESYDHKLRISVLEDYYKGAKILANN